MTDLIEVRVTHKTIGPREDPYAHQTTTIDNISRGTRAVRIDDSLAESTTVILSSPVQGVRTITWNRFHNTPQERLGRSTKAAILTRRLTGMTFDEAEEDYYHLHDDVPEMGDPNP